MSGVDLSLLVGAIIVAALCVRMPRGLIWLGAGALSYIGSVIWWRVGLPHGAAVAGALDVAICLGIYFFGRFKWEMAIWRLFQASVAINFLYQLSEVGVFVDIPHDAYSSMLEAINWLVLLTIGGTAALQGVRVSHDVLGISAWLNVRRVVLSLHEERARHSFLRHG